MHSIYLHWRGAFGVARFDEQGNAKALTSGTSDRTGSTFSCIYTNHLLIMPIWYPFSYKFDIGYTYVKYFPRSGNKLTLRLGIHNILGNPIKEEISNFYKVNLGQDCIPYGGIILSF